MAKVRLDRSDLRLVAGLSNISTSFPSEKCERKDVERQEEV